MRCKIVRDDLEVSAPKGFSKLPRSIQEMCNLKEVIRNGRQTAVPFWKRGTELNHPEAYMLVRQGVAIPADDECVEAANMTTLQMAAAQKAHDRLVARIEIEDYDLYDSGVILGYQPDATADSPPEEKYVPGPKWELYPVMRPGFYQGDEDDEG